MDSSFRIASTGLRYGLRLDRRSGLRERRNHFQTNRMDYTKALAAIEAIRQMSDRYPFGLSPNPDTIADAQKEIQIIREYCPSCASELHSLAGWLKILVTKAQHEKLIQPD